MRIQDCPRWLIMYSYAWPSSPKSVTQTQLAPETFLGRPSLSILHKPDHSPNILLSGTSINGTFFSRHNPLTNFLYAGSLQDSARNTTWALDTSICFATSCKPLITPSTIKARLRTPLTAPGKSVTSSSTSATVATSTSSSSSAMLINCKTHWGTNVEPDHWLEPK